jgi:RNA polymerase sigma-70 factor (ECF subfamily)
VEELTYLLLCAQRGDRAAFGQLAVRAEFLLLCWLRLCPDTRAACNEADDVIQETLLRAWQHRAAFDPAGSALPWLWRICHNIAVDLLRRRRTRAARSLDLGAGDLGVPSRRPSPEEVAEAREAWALLQQVLARLPPAMQQLIRYHYFNGWSHAECAERLGLTPHAFNMRLFGARKELRAALERHDVGGDSLRALLEMADDRTDESPETTRTR